MGSRLRGPRRINFVSVLLTLAALVAGYAGYKLIPVYWRAHKVAAVLDVHRHEAAELDLYDPHRQEEKLMQTITEEILDLGGIDEAYLQVYFDTDHKALRADYTEFIHTFFGKTYTLELSRSVDLPTDE